MFQKIRNSKQAVALIPVAGMLLFLIFYLIAANLYPGGSMISPLHPGFDLKNNYLCDLMDHYAINGEANPASLYARIAFGLLCMSLMLLWYLLPGLFKTKKKVLMLMRLLGMLSMGTALFLASGIHDLITRISGIFGILALLILCLELIREGLKTRAILGVFTLLMILSNFYIYESESALDHLPLLQKFTFLSCIIFFSLLNASLIQKQINA